MKVLIAEDNPTLARVLESLVRAWGYDLEIVADGTAAWQILMSADPPKLALLDWMMPGMSGVDICSRLRAEMPAAPIYLILLTCRENPADIVAGLQAGANDYVTKPFDAEELHARIRVGKRVVELQSALSDRISELQKQRQELSRVNRALTMLYSAAQAVIRTANEIELLREICRIIVDNGNYRLAWVGYPEPGVQRRIRPVAQAGYEDTMRISWGEQDSSRSPMKTALKTGRTVILRHIARDPYFAPVKTATGSHDYAAVISLPLIVDGKIVGVLCVYSSEETAFTGDEEKLLSMLAEELSFGIESLRSTAERLLARDELSRERDQAQQYLDVAGVLLVVLTPAGRIARINKKGCELLEYSEQELMGAEWLTCCVQKRSRKYAAELIDQLLQGDLSNLEYCEYQVVTKSGIERVLAFHNALMHDPVTKAITGVLLSGEDITARKEAEEALRRSEQSYRELFESSVAGGAAMDAYRAAYLVGRRAENKRGAKVKSEAYPSTLLISDE